MKKKTIMIIVGVLIAVLIVWKLASNKKELNLKSKPSDTAEVSIPVKVATVQLEAIKMDIKKTGSVVPFKESKVLTTSGGTIQKCSIELGQTVERGQVLAVLDHSASSLDLQKAETNAAKLKEDVQTYTELLKGKATTDQKVKDLTLQYNDALSQVNQIRKKISDTNIKAPISGMVSTKDVEEGVFANTGTQIATIVDITKIKVRVNLAEREAYQVKLGQSVKIVSDVFPDHEFTGVLSFISPQADDAHNYMAEIRMDNHPKFLLRSGTFVTAYFPITDPQNVLVVPQEALTGGSENASAYVVNNGRVKLKNIKTGREVKGLIEIADGLRAGDQVVISGQINLADSTRVSITN
ncbi:MAG TPA: efflux RND transporter periplasmic adaptor subunit [Cyclobacteriaceae bacterium]|jgi:RND family efflux transporter MFP subunit|nr:efflux RND transporter periplasmic adaptor subunit [Cyclobacteriaceae bacterium]